MSKTINMLLYKAIRPLFSVSAAHNTEVMCLFDTGAIVPVWCGSKDYLELTFPDFEDAHEKFLLGGFGKNPEFVSVYKIPNFVMKDGTNSLIFRELYIGASFDRKFGCDLVLSVTMFSHMDYSVINRRQSRSILRIEYDKDIYQTALTHDIDTGYVKTVYSFASNEDGQTEKVVNRPEKMNV